MPTTQTPFRYPGGKSSFYPLVSALIADSGLKGCTYAEPFAGGGGLALKLLLNGDVSSIVLNDLDPAVAAMWSGVVSKPDSMLEFIRNVPLNIGEWEKYHEMYVELRKKALTAYNSSSTMADSNCKEPLDYLTGEERTMLAHAAFYLNRTNRSGIMDGGPIGGRGQSGAYSIDARFNRTTLGNKIEKIALKANRITVTNLDVFDFMNAFNEQRGQNGLLLCLDPPYVNKGPGLYQNAFSNTDHSQLAELIRRHSGSWIVTYDDCSFIRQLYTDVHTVTIDVNYSAHSTRKASEIMMLSGDLASTNTARRLSEKVA